jgi:hypothetical protein
MQRTSSICVCYCGCTDHRRTNAQTIEPVVAIHGGSSRRHTGRDKIKTGRRDFARRTVAPVAKISSYK